MMQKDLKEFIGALLIIALVSLVAEFMARAFPIVHFGKDQGLVFRVIIFVLSCTVLYGYVCRKRLVGLFIGMVVGIVAQVCSFATLLVSSLLVKGDFSGWDIPPVWDQLIAICFLLLFRGFSRPSRRSG